MYQVAYFFLIFIIYSVFGYFVEIISVSLEQKKLVFSRGYLIGPCIPIFGFGGLIVTLVLSQYQNDAITTFAMTMFYGCLLEYFTSLFLETIFKLRWWDYSDKKYNLNGRVCLEIGALFGIAGILIAKVINPILFKFLNIFSRKTIIISACIIFVILLADFCLSTFTIIRLKIDTNKYLNKDATSKIKTEVRKSLEKYRPFYNRLFNAFPKITKDNTRILKIKEISDKIKKKMK